MKLTSLSHLVRPSLVAAALAAFGCVGQVDQGSAGSGAHPGMNGDGSGAERGNGSGSTSGGAVTGSGGTGGTGGVNNPPSGSGGTAPVGPRDPGRVTMRLLNRVEYNNTVRDLLGTTLQPALSFLNDAPEFGFDNNGDMLSVSPVQADLYLKAAEALAADALTPTRRAALVTCDLATGEACLRTIITNFGKRAFRRPLTTAEITGFLAVSASARTAGATADEALRTVVEAMLMSSHFLYRVELDPEPTSLAAHPVAPHEMASRLSYLIYRSMPDQSLFDAATAGKLTTPAEIQAQLTRMLADPKGATFARDFSTQWLGARNVESVQFNQTLFPKFNAALAASMKTELTSFFEEFVRENRPASELLTADFSYLDDNLARHYGLPAVGVTGGGALKRTALGSPQRGGLLTMAGTLAVTSYATRTSLVKRGAWVLGHLLCSQPPPPPPEADGFPEAVMGGTQREILEMHRTKPSCAVCHVVMDNIGIALENYDAVGAWRTTDRSGATIDARGVLPGGAPFTGGRELATVIAADPRLNSCVARNMLTYALGRSLSQSDDPYINDIAAADQGSAPGLRDILTRVATSDTFRMRHGEPTAPGGTQP